jgi:hypothetical protein
MMHGRGKSDEAIVAVKPANKALHTAAEQSTAELFAAEPVEPRAETKRNAGQQSTCGTQGQISVSQALWSEPYAGKLHVRIWCSEASCHSSG